MTDTSSEADLLARRVAATLYARDRAAQAMGIELLDVRAGFARVAFVVRDDMLNGFAICHGGYVFGLADTAFAYACNGRNDVNVALQCSISFALPARAGQRLEATAAEQVRGGRTGTYDIEVRDADTRLVALFRGTSYRVNAHTIDATPPQTA